eukprot:4534986-Alexandrium_andersonii.AAC.1
MLKRPRGWKARGRALAPAGRMGPRTLRALTTSWSMLPWLPACSGMKCPARRCTTPAGRSERAL